MLVRTQQAHMLPSATGLLSPLGFLAQAQVGAAQVPEWLSQSQLDPFQLNQHQEVLALALFQVLSS